MDANLKETLPQEGTSPAGESLPEHSSGCPTYSGGGTNLQLHETVPDCNLDVNIRQQRFLDDVQQELRSLRNVGAESPVRIDGGSDPNPLNTQITQGLTQTDENQPNVGTESPTRVDDDSNPEYPFNTPVTPDLPPPEENECNDNENKMDKLKKSKKKQKKSGCQRRARALLQRRLLDAGDVACSTKGGTWVLAIVPTDYPANILQEEIYLPIQRYLWDKLEATPDPIPIINVGFIVSGVLRVACDGDNAARWLRTLNGIIVNGVKLKVVDLKDLFKSIKMAWRVKTTKADITRILNMLQRMHPVLNVNNWKILDTVVEVKTTRRIILMDHVSAEYIKSKNYYLSTGVDLSIFKFMGEVDIANC